MKPPSSSVDPKDRADPDASAGPPRLLLCVSDLALLRELQEQLREQLGCPDMICAATPSEVRHWLAHFPVLDGVVWELAAFEPGHVALLHALRQHFSRWGLPLLDLSTLPGARPENSVGPSAQAHRLLCGEHLARFVERLRRNLETASEKGGAPAPPRVLLADDQPSNQLLARALFERLGCTYEIVGNGREAFEAVRSSFFEVAILDVNMPQMSGLEATARIRTEIEPRHQPWIAAWTACTHPLDRLRCVDAGMDDFLTKPGRLDSFRHALLRQHRRHLRRALA